jgi:hypothetical protein
MVRYGRKWIVNIHKKKMGKVLEDITGNPDFSSIPLSKFVEGFSPSPLSSLQQDLHWLKEVLVILSREGGNLVSKRAQRVVSLLKHSAIGQLV